MRDIVIFEKKNEYYVYVSMSCEYSSGVEFQVCLKDVSLWMVLQSNAKQMLGRL